MATGPETRSLRTGFCLRDGEYLYREYRYTFSAGKTITETATKAGENAGTRENATISRERSKKGTHLITGGAYPTTAGAD